MRLLKNSNSELFTKLQYYLSRDPQYRAVYEHTQHRFEQATNLIAHNWAHCYRDTLNAIVIGEAEGADMSIVLPAATMHDIGFLYGASPDEHGEVGAQHVAEFLAGAKARYTNEQIQQIAECIRTHKGSIHNKHPESLEAKVVADADLLEKFGPFGVYQTIRTYTEFNWPIERAFERGDRILNVRLETETGRTLAEPGRLFVADFYASLKDANQPYESNEKSKSE